MSEGAGAPAPAAVPGLTRLFVSSLPALILQAIIQRPEYNKDYILNSMQSLICEYLLYGP